MDYFEKLMLETQKHHARLIAVSKNQPVEKIMELYARGHRAFGENRAQELIEKAAKLPADIEWHMIGHLQRNKVKQVLPLVSMIHSVDSHRLLKAIHKMTSQNKLKTDVLLQFHIARESSKYGLTPDEAKAILEETPPVNWLQDGVRICGVMGMATLTDDRNVVSHEFKKLKAIFNRLKQQYFANVPYFSEISMGMSGDYELALQNGSTMVRIGSLLFPPDDQPSV